MNQIIRNCSEKETCMDFRKELESLINRHSKENGSNTPDFILAEYIDMCLDAFDNAVISRDSWYGYNQLDTAQEKLSKEDK